ncbi:MAG: NADPH-dependent F420 reductase [Bacteriovoracaceae bacterium]
MKVGILGSGIVGEKLSEGFLKFGYDVMRGSRDPEKLEDWQKKIGSKAKIGDFKETTKFGQLIVLAVKGEGALNALRECADNIKGKTIIDTTNPIASAPPVNGVLQYFTEINESLMERLQNTYPSAHFVKAFNSVGNAFMVKPQFALIPTMFICGNHQESKTKVAEILNQFGWESQDMGTVEAARAIEPLCMLWCIPGFRNNEWNHAFKLMRN